MSNITNLESISEVIGDGLHGTPLYDEFGEYYFINGSNLVEGIIKNDGAKKVNFNEYAKYQKPLNDNTILLSINGTIGNLALYNGEKCILGKSAAYICLKNTVNRNYIYYVLKSRDFQSYLLNANGTTIKNVSLKMLRDYTLNLPDIEVQDKIGNQLYILDQFIRVNRKINDYLSECCTTFIKNIVNQCSDYCDLSHYCTGIYSGGTPATKVNKYWNGEIPWLSSGETCNLLIIDTEKTISKEGVENSSTRKAFRGDVVMASAGQGHTRGQVSLLCIDTYVNQSVLVMSPKDHCSAYLLFELKESYEKIRSWSDSTSSRGSMSGSLLKEFQIPLLSDDNLFKIDSFCSPIINLMSELSFEIKNLESLRNTLISKLIS